MFYAHMSTHKYCMYIDHFTQACVKQARLFAFVVLLLLFTLIYCIMFFLLVVFVLGCNGHPDACSNEACRARGSCACMFDATDHNDETW